MNLDINPTSIMDYARQAAKDLNSPSGLIGYEISNPLPELLTWIRIGEPEQKHRNASLIKLAPKDGIEVVYIGGDMRCSYYLVKDSKNNIGHIMELVQHKCTGFVHEESTSSTTDSHMDDVFCIHPDSVPSYILVNLLRCADHPETAKPQIGMRID